MPVPQPLYRATRIIHSRSRIGTESHDPVPAHRLVRIIRHRNTASRMTISGKMRDVCAMLNQMVD